MIQQIFQIILFREGDFVAPGTQVESIELFNISGWHIRGSVLVLVGQFMFFAFLL